ncbi:MAG: nuclear transport factor 2 family protein [Bacteroidales bacterium]|nr:nuclear transport factor 2 family protein [Bacteroidales bacterium]
MATKTMTTREVADRLVELCRKGLVLEAQQELFADEVTSHEPAHSQTPPAIGKEAVLAKGKHFVSLIEERRSGSFEDPIIAGDYFSFVCKLDATLKGVGKVVWDEICVFGVKNGKVISEQFFY